MKRVITLLLSIILFQSFLAAKEKDKSLNFGIKAGFNSSMYFVDEFRLVDVTINEIQNNYKVGYLGAIFLRKNFNKHFIQPEIHYSISRSEIMFDKRGSQHPEFEPDYATINSTIHSFELPILYGYNFVKSKPYEMCFFVGPKPKYVWNQKSKLEFDNFDQKAIEEDLNPININIVAGVAVTISRIFFDFSYETGLHNISRSVTYETINEEGNTQRSTMVFKRRSNILSFSFGMIF